MFKDFSKVPQKSEQFCKYKNCFYSKHLLPSPNFDFEKDMQTENRKQTTNDSFLGCFFFNIVLKCLNEPSQVCSVCVVPFKVQPTKSSSKVPHVSWKI